MKKMSSWYAFLRFEESRYRILGMQIWTFVKNPIFKYEFLWLFIYPCPTDLLIQAFRAHNEEQQVWHSQRHGGEMCCQHGAYAGARQKHS